MLTFLIVESLLISLNLVYAIIIIAHDQYAGLIFVFCYICLIVLFSLANLKSDLNAVTLSVEIRTCVFLIHYCPNRKVG